MIEGRMSPSWCSAGPSNLAALHSVEFWLSRSSRVHRKHLRSRASSAATRYNLALLLQAYWIHVCRSFICSNRFFVAVLTTIVDFTNMLDERSDPQGSGLALTRWVYKLAEKNVNATNRKMCKWEKRMKTIPPFSPSFLEHEKLASLGMCQDVVSDKWNASSNNTFRRLYRFTSEFQFAERRAAQAEAEPACLVTVSLDST